MINTENLDGDYDKMSIEEFREQCDNGVFIDEDGFGYLGTDNFIDQEISIKPSKFLNNEYDLTKFTQIYWFNC